MKMNRVVYIDKNWLLICSTGHSYTDIEVDAIMNLGDLDADGEINLEELVTLMSPQASEVIAKDCIF